MPALSKEDRTHNIVESARALFRIKPLDEITTREIADKAGVGEATLFRHIGSKDHLLSLVYGDELDALLEEIDRQDNDFILKLPTEKELHKSAVYRVLRIYEQRSEFFAKNPLNGARYLLEGFQLIGPNWKRNMAQGDRTIRKVRGILYEAQEAGVLSNVVDAHLVAENIHAIYMHEIYRGPARGYTPDSLWQRLKPRLETQLSLMVRE